MGKASAGNRAATVRFGGAVLTKENGFTPIRRGVWEHVRDGRLSLQDVAVYQYIISQCDTRTGTWKGSAGALSGELGMCSSRAARRILERLENGDYIRRFARQGERFCYPILVHKFPITQGEHMGEVTNALASTFQKDCLHIAYFPRQVKGDVMGEVEGEVSASQRRTEKETRRQEKKNAAKNAPLADPRFQTFFDFAFETFTSKHIRKPLWQGKDRNGLRNLLRGHSSESLPLERLQRNWRNFLDSTEPFTVKQGCSLAYFCSNLDKFSDGPILQSKGKATGKDINDDVATTMQGAAIAAGITH